MHSIVQTLIAWGLPGLLILALVDSAGIPLPAGVDALVVTLAVLTPSQAYFSAAVATAGSLAGCLILFLIARKGGQRYLDSNTQTGKGRMLRVWFQRYGLATVFVTALLPIPLPTKVFVLSAGACGAKVLPFLLVVLAARVPRYFGLAYLGLQLGTGTSAWLRAHVWHLTVTALLLLGLILLFIRQLSREGKKGTVQADGF